MQGRQHDQLQDSAAIHHAASKAKEKIRLNSLKLLHFDSRDVQLINDSYQQVLNFADGLQLSLTLTTQDIVAALQAAHKDTRCFVAGLPRAGSHPLYHPLLSQKLSMWQH